MEVGDKQEVRYRIQTSDFAKSLAFDAYDDFPEVYATSRMIALMELAAARLMQPLLSEGQLSVGVNVNVDNIAAILVDTEVTAVAIYQGREEKLYRFTLSVYDPMGQVGVGSHTRMIIGTERLLKGAQQRVK